MAIKQYRPIQIENQKIVDLIKAPESKIPLPGDVVKPPVDGGFYMSIGELIDLKELEPFNQRPITKNGVLKVLTGLTISGSKATGQNYPLIDTKVLLKPITIGFNQAEEAEPIGILGGRHRLTALLTAYSLQGIDIDSDEFRDQLIRVIPEEWDIRTVEADNTSRAMTKTEKGSIHIQDKHPTIDMEDVNSILTGHYEGKLTLNEALVHATLALIFSDEKRYVLDQFKEVPTELAIHNIVSGVTTKYKQNFKAPAKFFTKYPDQMVPKFLQMVVSQLPIAVNQFLAEGGSNIARDYSRIVGILLPMVAKLDLDAMNLQAAKELGEKKPTSHTRATKNGKVKTIQAAAQKKVADAENNLSEGETDKSARKPRARKGNGTNGGNSADKPDLRLV